MSDDPLDKEVAIAAEITPDGMKASARSRLIAAFDRFGGNLVDYVNVPIEERNRERRALADARVQTINTLTELALDRLKVDPALMERAITSHLEKIVERQGNKDAVLNEAIEDLRRQAPTDEEMSSGPDELSDAFQNRFERYAEDATTDELREKWGRVLAAEVRKPGTFSGKVLRVIDELDPETAALFERVCQNRIANVIPKALSGELQFLDAAKLVSAGLLVEPGLGQIRRCDEVTDSQDTKLWLWGFDVFAIGVTVTASVSSMDNVLGEENGKPTILTYVLTDVGLSISSILPNDPRRLIDQLAVKISEAMPTSQIRKYEYNPQNANWVSVGAMPPRNLPS